MYKTPLNTSFRCGFPKENLAKKSCCFELWSTIRSSFVILQYDPACLNVFKIDSLYNVVVFYLSITALWFNSQAFLLQYTFSRNGYTNCFQVGLNRLLWTEVKIPLNLPSKHRVQKLIFFIRTVAEGNKILFQPSDD